MATTTRVLNANVTGTVYNTNLNSTLEALDTSHSGPTAPTDEVVNGKLWLDTSTTPGILRIYNNATWEVVHSGTVDINGGSIDGTTIGGTTPAAGTFTGVGVTGTVTATSFSGDGSGLTGITSTPASTVIYVAQNTAPTGYLKANGAAISRTTYADLFAAIGTTFGTGDGSTTFNVPDLRGEFIRAWDDARGVDSGRSFGSAQADEFESHNHIHGMGDHPSSR